MYDSDYLRAERVKELYEILGVSPDNDNMIFGALSIAKNGTLLFMGWDDGRKDSFANEYLFIENYFLPMDSLRSFSAYTTASVGEYNERLILHSIFTDKVICEASNISDNILGVSAYFRVVLTKDESLCAHESYEFEQMKYKKIAKLSRCENSGL